MVLALTKIYTVGEKGRSYSLQIRPDVGCNKELCCQFDFDMHILKHKEKFCLEQMKYLRGQKRLDTKKRKITEE